MRRAASRLTRGLAAAALSAGAAAAAASAGAAGGGAGLLLDSREGPPDAPGWVCAEGAAAPESLRLEAVSGGAAVSRAWSFAWGGVSPLRLLAALPPRADSGRMPFWDQDGSLPPGDYRLLAEGFAPETLRVREPSAAERRQRGVLARVRLRAAEGDSALAARLAERLLELEPGGPYGDAAFLALGRLWRHSKFRERPETWLSEWIARHHSRCCVGEGIRVWLASVPEPLGSAALRRVASRYPDTRASAAAAAYLERQAKSARRR